MSISKDQEKRILDSIKEMLSDLFLSYEESQAQKLTKYMERILEINESINQLKIVLERTIEKVLR